MPKVNKGQTAEVLPTAPSLCCFPGCSAPAERQHHVTYDPEVIKPLCKPHHDQITIINGIQGRKHRRQLSNKQRWWIWYSWLRGELKPRRTRKALEWVESDYPD